MSVPDLHPPTEIEKPLILNDQRSQQPDDTFKKNKYPPVSYYLHAFRLRRFMKNQHFNQPKPAVHIGSEALLCTSSRSSKTIGTEAFVLPNSGGKKKPLATRYKS